MARSKGSARSGKRRANHVGSTSSEMAGKKLTEPLPEHLKGKYGKVQRLPPK